MQVQLYFIVADLSSCANLWAVLHLCDVFVLLHSLGSFLPSLPPAVDERMLAVFTLRHVYLLDIDLG